MEKAATHFSIVHAKTCPTVLSRCFNLTCCNMAGHLPLAIWTLVCIQLLHWAITFLLLWHFGFCRDILGWGDVMLCTSHRWMMFLSVQRDCFPGGPQNLSLTQPFAERFEPQRAGYGSTLAHSSLCQHRATGIACLSAILTGRAL